MSALGTMVRHEMRSLMRQGRAPVALGVCTAAGVAVVCLFMALTPELRDGCTPEAMARAGRRLFRWLTLLEAAVVVVLTPLLTADALAGERRRGTLEALLLTRLTPRELVRGKLGAALGFLLAALGCLLPVQATGLLLGGVSPWEILLVFLLLLGVALCIGAVALHASARVTALSTALSLAAAGAVTVLTPLHWLFLLFKRDTRDDGPLQGTPEHYEYRMSVGLLIVIAFGLGWAALFSWRTALLMLCAISPGGALALLLFPDLPGAQFWLVISAFAALQLRLYTRSALEAAARHLTHPDGAPRQGEPPPRIMPVCPPQAPPAGTTPSRRW